MTFQPTACILCECNCGIEVELEGRTLKRIRGDKRHPASQGYTCNKAMRLDYYQNGKHRLQSPLRRREDGTFEEIDWDTAIAEVAAKFAAVRDEHGGGSIFYYGGGGQGNHLGGAYSGAFLKTLGTTHRSSALAQEKTGEAWVDAQLYGGHTRGEFEHAEVSVFIGKNPWQSQSFPRARAVLKEIAKDPGRAMIVIDPVVTESAAMADIHLQVRPGSDAWALAALVGVLVQEDLVDHDFLADHANGAEAVLAVFADVPVAEYCAHAGLDEDLVREAARRIGGADSVAVFEDLGIQQGPNSTLCSYINKMLWILTGSFAKPGGQHLHSWMGPLFGTKKVTTTPVTGELVLGGLTPCNVIPDEILTDHPKRFRAMLVESSNPAHSLADTQRMGEALDALDLLVVIDVAMTETARRADYVLPASSQFEKCEATFFNLEFPRNDFHLRHPLLEPLEGTLPEPEMYARLVRALGVLDDAALQPLRAAAAEGLEAFTAAFGAAVAENPGLMAIAPVVLYETLGETLPAGLKGAAALWGLAVRVSMFYPAAMQRAGHADANALFTAIIEGASGITFTVNEYEEDWDYVAHPDKKFALELPELLDGVRALRDQQPGWTTAEFPIVLSVGERRGYTANTIYRNAEWRKRDMDGALRISLADAETLGLADGAAARITTARGTADAIVEVSERMQAGHASIPNGYGLGDGPGVAPNTLTSTDWRDPIAGTPWHKHVPAAITPIVAAPTDADSVAALSLR